MPRRRSVEQVMKDARAVDLRRRNFTYRQIATELGYSSTASAHEAVGRGLEDLAAEGRDEARRLEAERYDEMQRKAWQIMYQTHLVVSTGGKVVLHPTTNLPLTDSGPTLKAIEVVVRISERRAKLLGLDAPTRVRAEVQHVDALDQEIESLLEKLGAGGESAPTRQAEDAGT